MKKKYFCFPLFLLAKSLFIHHLKSIQTLTLSSSPKLCFSKFKKAYKSLIFMSLLGDYQQNISLKTQCSALKKAFLNWKEKRHLFSNMAWDIYPQLLCLYALLKCDAHTPDTDFVQSGYKQGLIVKKLYQPLLDLLETSKTIPIVLEDFDNHYQHNASLRPLEHTLNQNHSFFLIEQQHIHPLKTILESLKEPIAECLGSPWRPVNIRIWKSNSCNKQVGPNEWHSDGYSTNALKILVYLSGADYNKGTTELLIDGKAVPVEGPCGTWVLFRNSEIIHRGISPSNAQDRIVIEITLTASFIFDLEPVFAGINASLPLLPWLSRESTLTVLPDPVHAINIGGGPLWKAKGWKNLEEVKSTLNPQPFRLWPHCTFPFDNHSLSTVYSSHAIEHFNAPTISRVLSEAFRVLKDQGDLIIKIPDYDKALECWNNNDPSFFAHDWNYETVIDYWKSKNIPDSLDYRAAMVFCSFYNDACNNPFDAHKKPLEGAYFGPPTMDISSLRAVIANASPKDIANILRTHINQNETNFQFCHQSAWSRQELAEQLSSFGFSQISFDTDQILKQFHSINGIEEMQSITTFCWAKKSTAKG